MNSILDVMAEFPLCSDGYSILQLPETAEEIARIVDAEEMK